MDRGSEGLRLRKEYELKRQAKLQEAKVPGVARRMPCLFLILTYTVSLVRTRNSIRMFPQSPPLVTYVKALKKASKKAIQLPTCSKHLFLGLGFQVT